MLNKLVVVIINGYPGAGKDTFVNLCQFIKSVRVFNVLTSTPMKNALRIIGWDEVKTPETRKILSDLKDLSTRLWDYPFKYVSNKLELINKLEGTKIVFIHSREPEEIERFKEAFDAITLFINREPTEVLTNHADLNVKNYLYDVTIDNNGTLEKLRDQAEMFTYYIMERVPK